MLCKLTLTLFLGILLVLVPVACTNQKSVDSQSLPPPSVADDPLIAHVDALLNKEAADEADIQFVLSLSPAEIDRITSYYEANPRIKSEPGDEIRDDLEPSAAADTWTGETIECRDGYGGWVASSWMHTTACGGDGSDHFYYYPGVPGAYNYRGYLQGRSIHPAVLMVLASYGWKLSARVYPSNNVYICVGVRIHAFGLTHEAWRTSFYLYRVA